MNNGNSTTERILDKNISYDILFNGEVKNQETEVRTNEKKGSFLQGNIPSKTKISSLKKSQYKYEIDTNSNTELSNYSLATPLINKIEAVVSKLDENFIDFMCNLPNEEVEISVPKILVPEDLAVYGTPVYISIENVDGYKQPQVSRRFVEHNPHLQNELSEIDQWINNISE